jgi:hypothetical protein
MEDLPGKNEFKIQNSKGNPISKIQDPRKTRDW